jgi:hypothetical protein
VLTRKFFAPLRITDVDAEATGAGHAIPKQGASRKSGRPPPIVMTYNKTHSTKKRLKRKCQIKVRVLKYTKWNPYGKEWKTTEPQNPTWRKIISTNL